MALFGSNKCDNDGGDWIWIIIFVVLIFILCGDGGLFGNKDKKCCDPCCPPPRPPHDPCFDPCDERDDDDRKRHNDCC